MTKSYTDQCLERAEKATEGPWYIGHVSEIVPDAADLDSANGVIADNVYGYENRTFLIRARTDVPELARRLKKACERLRDMAMKRRDYEYIDELEAPLEEK